MVGRGDVMNANYFLWLDLTEHSDFVDSALLKFDITTARNLTQVELLSQLSSSTYET